MPKTYDKKAWLEQKELTKEENLKIIQNIVNNFKEDPEKILEFIDFQSRFYNYSTRNTMLIYAQNPGALFVGSFAAIKKITDELALIGGYGIWQNRIAAKSRNIAGSAEFIRKYHEAQKYP